MSRDISHRPVDKNVAPEITHRQGGRLNTAWWRAKTRVWKVVKVFRPSNAPPSLQSHVSGRAGEPQPWAISNGAFKKQMNTNTHMLLIIAAGQEDQAGEKKHIVFKSA